MVVQLVLGLMLVPVLVLVVVVMVLVLLLLLPNNHAHQGHYFAAVVAADAYETPDDVPSSSAQPPPL